MDLAVVRDGVEILQQLPGLAGHLKPDVTIADLEREARAKTDTAVVEYAGSQTKAICQHPPARGRHDGGSAVEMAGL